MTAFSNRNSPGEEPLGTVGVLVVDDDEQWTRVTARRLTEGRPSFEVGTAHTLAAGRRQFEAGDPDCVVCDYQLGDGTGLAMLETVRDADPDLPFLLVTGRGSETVASEAISSGVTDYIQKGRDDATADLLAGRIENAVRAYRTERALARERHSKDAMLDILTATTGRTDLVQQFCTQLVDGRDYACAWIGTDEPSGSIAPLVSAGRDEYLDAAGVPDARSSEMDPSPAVRAIAEDEPVVLSPLADPAGSPPGPWRAAARDQGFEAVAALPVRHDGVRFGVLAVYATEPTAIDDRERRFLAEYAETVGYALRTAELKRSLLADRPVTVDIAVTDDAAPLVALSDRLDSAARLEVLSVLDRGDGSTLLLAEVSGTSADAVRDATESLGSVSLRNLSPDSSPPRCELLVTAPTPEAVLAAHGGRFERTDVERGTATVTALVPDDGTVTNLTNALSERYDGSAVTTIWTDRTRELASTPDDPLADLTDRQREVVSYAFHHGYYETPRDTSATELAEAFDIARATLTQHLRTAERRLLAHLLDR